MVNTAVAPAEIAPLPEPISTLDRRVTPTGRGFRIDYKKPTEPKVTDLSGNPLDAKVDTQKIMGTNYTSSPQGTTAYNEMAQKAQEDEPNNPNRRHELIKAKHRDDLEEHQVEITLDEEGKIQVWTGSGASKILARREYVKDEKGRKDWSKEKLVVYRRKMAEQVATKTEVALDSKPSDKQVDIDTTWDALLAGLNLNLNEPSAPPTTLPVIDASTVTNTPPLGEKNWTRRAVDLIRHLEQSDKIDLTTLGPRELQTLEQIGQIMHKLTDFASRKMNRVIMEGVQAYDAYRRLPTPVRFGVRWTVTMIPLLLLSQSNPPLHGIPDVHAGNIPIGGHGDITLGLPDNPVTDLNPPAVNIDIPTDHPIINPNPVDLHPPVDTPHTPTVSVDDVCHAATDGSGEKASDHFPWPQGVDKPPADYANDLFQPAAHFNSAVFDKVIGKCGNDAFNPDGTLIWDKVSDLIPRGEFETFNRNLEHVARIGDGTGDILHDSYMPKVPTPKEPPGGGKD